MGFKIWNFGVNFKTGPDPLPLLHTVTTPTYFPGYVTACNQHCEVSLAGRTLRVKANRT